jgi:long-chain acyl-CoA synthetase
VKANAVVETVADIIPFRRRETPDRTALLEMAPDDSLERTTFAGLGRAAESFAGVLHRHGAGPGTPVAIVMPNSSRWITAYYAVFRVGAVAVPLEYGALGTEPERIRFALEHSGAAVIVAEPADGEAIRALSDRPIVSVGMEEDGPPPPQPQVRPSDLAQILYTSGTTGPKKGVELTHGNVMANAGACCDRFDMAERDCMPALLPYHHAYPLTGTVVMPPLIGATAAVGDIRDRRSRTLLRECRPTVLLCVPRVLESMLQSVRSTAERTGQGDKLEKGMRLSDRVKRTTGVNVGRLLFRRLHRELFGGGQLRFCVAGGARISPAVLRDFFLLGIPVIQGWGMSELSPVGAVQEFSPFRFRFTRHYERKAGSIGKPMPGTRVEFTQSTVEDLSFDLGRWGEMLVSGPHVMRGYHKDAESTAKQMAGEAIRTGDIARRDKDGDLYIIGRVKHVIVLPSGKKVFPEDDLEEPVASCRTIAEFAVRPIRDASGDEQIGIVVRPNLEELAGVQTLGELYGAVKKDIDGALAGKPSHLKQYDFCLTAWEDGDYAEVVKSAMGDACPLRNEFTPETAYSSMKGSEVPVPFTA